MMNYPNNSVSNNGSFGLQNNIVNRQNTGLNFNNKTNSDNTAYFAKKGEPMYIKEMDADEDGIVSFEEFKDYCQANGISEKEMIRMATMASSYRTMKAAEKSSEAIQKKSETSKNDNIGAVYAKRGDAKYDEAMDANNDDKITYKEYLDYCKENAQAQEQKSNTTSEQTEDGEFNTTSAGKAVSAYASAENNPPEGKVDDIG